MSDLLDDTDTGNTPEFSVSDITGAVKRTLEGAFGRVRVKGEVGRVVHARSGHLYFDLKDDRSVIASVAWKGVASRLQHKPEEGMEVVASGKITTFGPQSKYQLIVDDIQPAGLGALMVMLEKRRKALEAEGLFAPERKKRLPYLPEIIGVVTSPQGAVIRDILHRLRDRFPRKVLLWPVAVQGEACAPQVAAAIEGFNALTPGGALPRPDVIIVARGGGSIEDLWGFNEEVVVRAAAASDIPLISAVGHETDTTLIDHASDLRAPTPTAAAEHAVPVRAELIASLAALEERRIRAGTQGITRRRETLRDLARVLPKPGAILADKTQRFDTLADRLPRALHSAAAQKRLNLERRTGIFGPRLLDGYFARKRDRLAERAEALPRGLVQRTERVAERLNSLKSRFSPNPLYRCQTDARRMSDALSERFSRASAQLAATQRERLAGLERVRASLDHRAVLKRGFALVRDGQGALVPDVATAQSAASLEIEFRDGRMVAGDAHPSSGSPAAEPGPKPAKRRKPPAVDDDQGSLF